MDAHKVQLVIDKNDCGIIMLTKVLVKSANFGKWKLGEKKVKARQNKEFAWYKNSFSDIDTFSSA